MNANIYFSIQGIILIIRHAFNKMCFKQPRTDVKVYRHHHHRLSQFSLASDSLNEFCEIHLESILYKSYAFKLQFEATMTYRNLK
jgi:hypothetical protein